MLNDTTRGDKLKFYSEDINAWNKTARQKQFNTKSIEGKKQKYISKNELIVNLPSVTDIGDVVVLPFNANPETVFQFGSVLEKEYHSHNYGFIDAEIQSGDPDSLIGVVIENNIDEDTLATIQYRGIVPVKISDTPTTKKQYVNYNGSTLQFNYYGRHRLVAKLKDIVQGESWYLVDINCYEKAQKEYLIRITGNTEILTDRQWQYDFTILKNVTTNLTPQTTQQDLGKAINTLQVVNTTGSTIQGNSADFSVQPLVSNPSILLRPIVAGAICKMYCNQYARLFTIPNAVYGACST